MLDRHETVTVTATVTAHGSTVTAYGETGHGATGHGLHDQYGVLTS